jgi:hypothetical protein
MAEVRSPAQTRPARGIAKWDDLPLFLFLEQTAAWRKRPTAAQDR